MGNAKNRAATKGWRQSILFTLGLVTALALARLWPEGAESGPPLFPEFTRAAAVFLIFFIQGMRLSWAELLSGISTYKANGAAFVWIFFLSTLLLFAMGSIAEVLGYPELYAGFIYLGLLPTTIATAVAFVSATQGHLPSALFITVATNLAGILWVPLGALLLIAEGSLPAWEELLAIYGRVCLLVLFPLLLAQVLKYPLQFVQAFLKRFANPITQGAILLIIYFSLAGNGGQSSNTAFGTQTFLVLTMLTGASLLLIHAGTWATGLALNLPRDQRLTLLFCGSQKTLAASLPLAAILYPMGQGLPLGVDFASLIAPLLLYHILQLLLASLLVPILNARRHAH